MSRGADWTVPLSPSAYRAIYRLPHKVAAAVIFHLHEDNRILYIGRVEHRAHAYRRP